MISILVFCLFGFVPISHCLSQVKIYKGDKTKKQNKLNEVKKKNKEKQKEKERVKKMHLKYKQHQIQNMN